MMKRIIPIVAIISLCAGGALIYIGIVRAVQPSASPEARAVIQQPAVQPTGRPTATGTPSPIPTPTIDWSDVDHERAKADALRSQADEAARIAQAKIDQANAVLLMANITLTLRESDRQQGTPTAEALIVQRELNAVYAIATSSSYQADATATAIAHRAAVMQGVKMSGLVIITGLIILGLFLILRAVEYRQDMEKIQAASLVPTAENFVNHVIHPADAPGILIPQRTGDPQAYSARRVPPPPAHIADNPQWIEAALAGESVAIDQWEKSGRYKGVYRELYRWLANNDLIVWKDKMILSENGIRAVSPHSPTKDTSPNNTPLPSVPYTDDTQNAGGGGEEE